MRWKPVVCISPKGIGNSDLCEVSSLWASEVPSRWQEGSSLVGNILPRTLGDLLTLRIWSPHP